MAHNYSRAGDGEKGQDRPVLMMTGLTSGNSVISRRRALLVCPGMAGFRAKAALALRSVMSLTITP